MKKELLDKAQLSNQEKDLLVGEICAEYERLRYNGTVKQVMEIYGYDTVNEYIEEKTKNFFRSGSGFAAYLDSVYLKRLGNILINYNNK
tara:strand:+ start:261 stop:527 length:267 start_codon:yes stop_codon:yes gene_type:complete